MCYTSGMETRVCSECQKPKPWPRGFGVRTLACRGCLGKREHRANPEKFRIKAAKVRAQRPWRAVLSDCRKFDKRHGHVNDLDLDFVKIELAKGCSYCGETSIRITLDRVDNTLGHSRSNVVPACIRCNYMRGSMPYVAWLHLIPKVQEARELGLFGTWRSVPFNRKQVAKLQPEELADPVPNPGRPKGYVVPHSKSKSFPTKEEVEVRVKTSSLRAVAKELGCSHVTVWKYLQGSLA